MTHYKTLGVIPTTPGWWVLGRLGGDSTEVLPVCAWARVADCDLDGEALDPQEVAPVVADPEGGDLMLPLVEGNFVVIYDPTPEAVKTYHAQDGDYTLASTMREWRAVDRRAAAGG